MSILSLIIKREFIAKVRNKSFIVMTFLSPLLFVGIAVFVGFLASMKADLKRIAIHDEGGNFVNEFVNDEEYSYHDLSKIDLQFVKDSVLKESYEGLIYIPKTDILSTVQNQVQFISNDSPSMDYILDVEEVIEKKITQYNYEKLAIDTARINLAKADVDIVLKKASGENTVKGLNEIKLFLGGAFGYLIMMFIVIYGNFVMRSVIEEKTNRIIEIIISSVKPFQLMMGKIIGNSLAGILQFLIWTILGLILFFVFSTIFGMQMGATTAVSGEAVAAANPSGFAEKLPLYINEFKQLPLFTLLFSFVIYFIGGFFLYSSFYAAIGAAVDNETDSQQFLLPIILPLILGVYVGFFTVLNDPHGTVATVFSIIPLTSPIVMLMRIPFGVPWWQLVLSMILLYVTFFLVVWFAAKIYRVGILMYGKKPSWKELYKWMKY
ncbi:ABC transporter permease [Flavobacterium lacus]|uniref:ABC-2 type transport system permease protein n=1 Tax=Flavobacterium lacus TaxID=1353778 RepID=A0A328WSP0_9FLAO|nr:ABC transporter permease [Flavobacterium lacus]RAR46874.1 ABC-2 type transport system permease protein [Flavobacterium lacus]